MSAADSVDVLVLGGGPAGSAAAIVLAEAGRSVVVVEKEAQAEHKVCGEFLSREALASLRRLRVEVEALGAVPIGAVRLSGRLGVSTAPLPFAAMSLTRRTLDEELLRVAGASGASVLRGRRAQSLEQTADGWQARLEDGSVVAGRAAFLATGKHDLRGWPRPEGMQADLIAFKMYWRLEAAQAAALAGHVELHLFRGGYAGLQPVEGGAANLCCVIRRAEFQALGGRWDALLRAMQQGPKGNGSLLRERLRGAEPLLVRPLAVAAIPYGYVRAHAAGVAQAELGLAGVGTGEARGVWALGDQAAVIPSFTGDGMSIALHSGCLAAEMYAQGASAEAHQQRLHGELAAQVALATKLSQGMVAEPRRTLMEAAVRLWPGALAAVAKRTRLRG